MRTRRILPAGTVYLAMEGVWGLLFYLVATTAAVYRIIQAELNGFELVLVGTVLEGTTLIFEVPTGVVADAISRRLSVLVGTFLTGFGFMLEGSIPSLLPILFAQVLLGIGYAFISGADVAWITDEIGEERARPLYLRGAQLSQLTALVGIAGSVGLASISLGMPLQVAGAGAIALGLFLAVAMPEEGFRPHKGVNRTAGDFLRPFVNARGALRRRPILLAILGVAALHGMSSEGFDRLWALQVIRNLRLPAVGELDRVVWFGVIQGVGLILAIAATELVRRRITLSTHEGAARAVAVINALLIVAVVAFANTGQFLVALVCLWMITMLRELNMPIYTTWINQDLDPVSRATVNSIGSQVDALGQVAGGPLLGWLAVARSVPAAITVAGLVRAPSLLVFARKREHR